MNCLLRQVSPRHPTGDHSPRVTRCLSAGDRPHYSNPVLAPRASQSDENPRRIGPDLAWTVRLRPGTILRMHRRLPEKSTRKRRSPGAGPLFGPSATKTNNKGGRKHVPESLSSDFAVLPKNSAKLLRSLQPARYNRNRAWSEPTTGGCFHDPNYYSNCLHYPGSRLARRPGPSLVGPRSHRSGAGWLFYRASQYRYGPSIIINPDDSVEICTGLYRRQRSMGLFPAPPFAGRRKELGH